MDRRFFDADDDAMTCDGSESTVLVDLLHDAPARSYRDTTSYRMQPSVVSMFLTGGVAVHAFDP